MKTKLIGTIASVAFACAAANGAIIQGVIDFTGGATLDSTMLGSATKVSTWNNVKVQDATGDFDDFVLSEFEGGPGDAVTLAPDWFFNSPGPDAYSPFWEVGGFTFNLSSSMIVGQSNTFLDVRGTGSVSGNGFKSTTGTWTFNISNASGASRERFTFQSSTSAVPDGGTSVALLGVSLLGLAGARRKFGR